MNKSIDKKLGDNNPGLGTRYAEISVDQEKALGKCSYITLTSLHILPNQPLLARGIGLQGFVLV